MNEMEIQIVAFSVFVLYYIGRAFVRWWKKKELNHFSVAHKLHETLLPYFKRARASYSSNPFPTFLIDGYFYLITEEIIYLRGDYFFDKEKRQYVISFLWKHDVKNNYEHQYYIENFNKLTYADHSIANLTITDLRRDITKNLEYLGKMNIPRENNLEIIEQEVSYTK